MDRRRCLAKDTFEKTTSIFLQSETNYVNIAEITLLGKKSESYYKYIISNTHVNRHTNIFSPISASIFFIFFAQCFILRDNKSKNCENFQGD